MPALFAPATPETIPQHTVVELIRRSAQNAPQNNAVICGERKISWLAFDLRVNQIANALIATGIKKGDRVAILASTSIEYVEIFMGTLRAGACIVPLSTMSSVGALQKMIEDSGSKVLFSSSSTLPLVEGFLSSLSCIIPDGKISLDFEGDDWVNYEDWLSSALQQDPEIDVDYEDLFNIIYSSGTTGVPKGILHNHMMRATQMSRVTEHGYTNQTRTLLSTPLYSNTTIVAMLPTLVAGGTIVLMPKFNALEYLKILEKERCTHTMLVPVQYKRIMDVAEFDQFDLSSMQMKFSTSAPLRAALKKDVLKRFPGGLTEYYGLTEGGGTTVLFAHLFPDKLNSVGQPAPDVELKFIDDQGTEVLPGEMGEICGRSPAMMSGYFGREDLTKDTLWKDNAGNTFFRTGDLGYMDEDGFLHLGDRIKDMIISGGLNIYANDLEQVLLQDNDVEDAAVIGVPSEAWGETPFGFVVVNDNNKRTSSDILAEANSHLGKSQRLSDVKIVQSLPRSQIGKILKRELRDLFHKAVSS